MRYFKNGIIVSTAAVREEGVSYHYLPDADEIITDDKTLEIIRKCLKSHGFKVFEGKIWTTDAVYRETPGKVQMMQKRGCLGVEMELSALMSVAYYRGVDFAEFLIAEDAVFGGIPKMPLYRNNQEILETAIEIMESL